MNIKREFPPNIKEIEGVLTPSRSALFCFGDTIYSPHLKGSDIDTAHVVHEMTHSRQQGDKPKEWWTRYLADESFRLSQELEAYCVQYRFYQQTGLSRDQLAIRLGHMAQALSSKMYGDCIGYPEAIKQIRNV